MCKKIYANYKVYQCFALRFYEDRTNTKHNIIIQKFMKIIAGLGFYRKWSENVELRFQLLADCKLRELASLQSASTDVYNFDV